MNQTTIKLDPPPKSKPLGYWVGKFNTYNAAATNKDQRLRAIAKLWEDWLSEEHKFKDAVNNAFSLFFYVTNYVPDRNIPEAATLGQPGTRIIHWNDSPIYDTVSNYWAGLIDWTCIDWVNYHKALKAHYNDQDKANMIWETNWHDPDNACGLVICPDTAYCRYNCGFVKYFASQGIDIGNVLSNAKCDLSNVVTNVTSTVSNVTGAIKTTSSVFSTIIPVASVGYFLWWGYDKFKNNRTDEK
ncbi:MAG: hypothetical protein ACRBFS_19400 [Aureispira sp.]